MNIVPTHYWIEEANLGIDNTKCYPAHWAKTNKVDYYCAKFEWNTPCLPFTKEVVDRFTVGFTKCMQKVRPPPSSHMLHQPASQRALWPCCSAGCAAMFLSACTC